MTRAVIRRSGMPRPRSSFTMSEDEGVDVVGEGRVEEPAEVDEGVWLYPVLSGMGSEGSLRLVRC